ncbi:hypothetical protein CRUP_018698 [Coryphaenoides rupestris]|nr:hypothetical protein CRUP_018698 [Coryphaenoides rupestris]
MACLRRHTTAIAMDTVKIPPTEKFPRDCGPGRASPRPPAWPWGARRRAGEGQIIVNQSCGDLGPEPAAAPALRREASFLAQRKATEICYHQFHYQVEDVIVNQYVLRSSSTSSSSSSSSSASSASSSSGPAMPCEPLDCPTCGHAYNFAGKRPRILSCLHSVCEECLQILYESCPKYKFISCPSCRRETVLFTDYGLAALAINTGILSRLPADGSGGGAGGGTVPWGGEADRSCYQTVRQYCQAACTCHLTNPLSTCGIM